MQSAPTIQFVNISTSLSGKCIIGGLSLTVPAGQTTVIMGPSGSGKTTLMRHLLQLLEPDSGEVLVDGHSVWDMSPQELAQFRRGTGVLLGGASIYQNSLFWSTTVLENIAYPLRAVGTNSDSAKRMAWQYLHDFNIDSHARVLPDRLPAGGQRRLALAKALATTSKLAVLDDPGPAFDITSYDTIVQAIERSQKQSRVTFVVTTHSITLAKALGDQVAILLDGKIAAVGPTSELLNGVSNADDFDRRFGFIEHFSQADLSPPRSEIEAARRQRVMPAWFIIVLVLIGIGLTMMLINNLFLENLEIP